MIWDEHLRQHLWMRWCSTHAQLMTNGLQYQSFRPCGHFPHGVLCIKPRAPDCFVCFPELRPNHGFRAGASLLFFASSLSRVVVPPDHHVHIVVVACFFFVGGDILSSYLTSRHQWRTCAMLVLRYILSPPGGSEPGLGALWSPDLRMSPRTRDVPRPPPLKSPPQCRKAPAPPGGGGVAAHNGSTKTAAGQKLSSAPNNFLCFLGQVTVPRRGERGRLRTACGQRCVDSNNSQTTPATTSTSSIRQLLGAADTQTAHQRHIQHSPNTPTTGLHKRGNDTSKSTGRSGRQNAATRRNMRREERVTVQGPVKEQQPDGMSHGGGGGQALIAVHGAVACGGWLQG